MLKGYVKADAEKTRRNNADTFLSIDNRYWLADSEKFTALMVAALTRFFDDGTEVELKKTKEGILLNLPKEKLQDIDTVVVLELK